MWQPFDHIERLKSGHKSFHSKQEEGRLLMVACFIGFIRFGIFAGVIREREREIVCYYSMYVL